jgi:ABC-type spermidine/putrescine transport system permease subunit II
MSASKTHRVLPGFPLTLGYTLVYLSLMVLIPLSAVFLKSMSLSLEEFWTIISAPRVVASYQISFGISLLAATINAVFGLIFAWVLVRYHFPGKRIIDALVDLPFALPTAVAGIALTALYAGNGWVGQWLEPLGIKVAFTPLGILVALTFIGLPFVVRTVQPVLEDLDMELEEAAASLGATSRTNLLAGHFAGIDAGVAHRFRPGLCPSGRGIRFGDLYRRQRPDGVGNHPVADYHQAGAVRLRRRDRHCCGHAGVFLHSVISNQRPANLGQP